MREVKSVVTLIGTCILLLIFLVIRDEIREEKIEVKPDRENREIVVVKTTLPSPARWYRKVECYIERDIKDVDIRDSDFLAYHDFINCFFKNDVLYIEIPEFYYRNKSGLDVSIKAVRQFNGKELEDWKDIKVIVKRKKNEND